MLRELTKEEQRDIIDRAERLLKAVYDFADPFYWLDEESADEVVREHYPFTMCLYDAVGQTADFVENIRENIGKFRIDD